MSCWPDVAINLYATLAGMMGDRVWPRRFGCLPPNDREVIGENHINTLNETSGPLLRLTSSVPVVRPTDISGGIQSFEPSYKGGYQSGRIPTLMPATTANIAPIEVAKARRDLWPRTTPIGEMLSDQHPRGCRGIMQQVWQMDPCGTAMERVRLRPSTGGRVSMVYIVTERLLLAAAEGRTFSQKLWVAPVGIKFRLFGYLHEINQITVKPSFSAAHTRNVVADLSILPDLRLAGRKSANAMKWIRRESKVMFDYIRV